MPREQLPIEVYPDDLLAGVARRMAGKPLAGLGRARGAAGAAEAGGSQAHAIAGDAAVAVCPSRLVLVGADRLGKECREQAMLLNLARRGPSVLVLRQTQPASLAGYPVSPQTAAEVGLAGRSPLGPPSAAVGGAQTGPEAWAVQLPADEPALEIAWWPARDRPATSRRRSMPWS